MGSHHLLGDKPPASLLGTDQSGSSIKLHENLGVELSLGHKCLDTLKVGDIFECFGGYVTKQSLGIK
jgi:hypothetical protein